MLHLVEAVCYKTVGSGRTKTQGSTQSLTKIVTSNVFCGERRPMRRAESIATFMYQFYWNPGSLQAWKRIVSHLYIYTECKYILILAALQGLILLRMD